MSRTDIRILACAVAALTVSAMTLPAMAQTQTPQAHVDKKIKREQMREAFEKRFFEKVDTDRDNAITREEFRRQADVRFDGLDVNHDGKLSRDEVHEKVKRRKFKIKNRVG